MYLAIQGEVDHLAEMAGHWASRLDYEAVATEAADDDNRWNPDSIDWAAIVTANGSLIRDLSTDDLDLRLS